MSDSQNFNLNDADGGRAYIAHLFKAVLKRHDYRQYIAERLAGDFACTLAQHFEDIKAREAALQQRLTAADERWDELVSAVRSINYGAAHKIDVPGDDEPQYLQRKEWIDWVLGLCGALGGANPAACTWRYGAFSWHTGCGQEWMLNDGTPEQNGMHFCHSCGKTLVVDEGQPESERES